MINSITVTNYLGTTKQFILSHPEESGFAITNIGGLGPVTSTINTSDMVTSDGSVYNSSRTGSRNITIGLIYMANGNKTIEQLRRETYSIFPNKGKITLSIETEEKKFQIEGYVESNEAVIFSQRCSSQISIICPNPYFIDITNGVTKTVNLSGVDKKMEWPIGDEEILDENSTNMINFGDIINYTEKNVIYNGTISYGFEIVIEFNHTFENIRIYNSKSGELLQINYSFMPNDILNISTIKNQKKIELLRDGLHYNIISKLDFDNSNWLNLYPGDNLIGYVVNDFFDNVLMKINYKEYCLAV